MVMFNAAIFNVTRTVRTAVLASAMLAVLLIAAQAKPSPYELPRAPMSPDFTAIAAPPSAVSDERAYFQAPAAAGTANRAGRCTVHAVVFAKISLAQACY
ncbi:MAG TPA: hypothetical protein VFC54_11820 [Pseudolabrys sp.]|nr:hypothetical protein [Pseudolabrys sp.]